MDQHVNHPNYKHQTMELMDYIATIEKALDKQRTAKPAAQRSKRHLRWCERSSRAIEQFGYDAYGMEPSADLVARGKARGLNIEQGTIENHSFEYGSFDMVCLWDVIEHLPDPKFGTCWNQEIAETQRYFIN